MADPFAARSARWRVLGSLAALVLLVAGCEERLTMPGECPELCPGGQFNVLDTILPAALNRDSSFVGYVGRGQGEALLVSNGLPGSEDRALIRFSRRPDSINISDTNHGYTIDSIAIEFSVRARDSLVNGLRAIWYRLPPTVDSTTTFAAVDAALIDANLVGTVPIPDDSLTGRIRTVLRGSELTRMAIPAGDSGVIALGMRVAPSGTGLRISSIVQGSPPTILVYVTVDIDQTAFQKQTIVGNAVFNTFVSQGTPVFDSNLLQVGGEPSARALLRFDFPPRLRDSVSIVRATLELVPTTTLHGLPNDPTFLEARALLTDLGAKSPLCLVGAVCGSSLISSSTLLALTDGSADTVRFEVPQIVRAWQGVKPAPSALFLIARPEGATFMRPVFYSTRSGVGTPRLRISYVPLSSTSP